MPSADPKYAEKKTLDLGVAKDPTNAILSQYAINCANYPVWQDSNLTLVTKKMTHLFSLSRCFYPEQPTVRLLHRQLPWCNWG